MSKFTTPLRIEAVENDGKLFSLLEEFEYYTDLIKVNNQSLIIKVPKDFKTDFASVPRLLWWLFPPYGLYGKAAVVHDFLYENEILGVDITKELADKIFLEAMEVLKVPKWKRVLMYNAVKLFGKGRFK